MKSLPGNGRSFRRTDTFTADTLPAGLTKAHTTKAGTWGRIVVLEGQLRYHIVDPPESHGLAPDTDGIIEPEVEHQVAPLGPVRFYVEFYR